MSAREKTLLPSPPAFRTVRDSSESYGSSRFLYDLQKFGSQLLASEARLGMELIVAKQV